MKREPRFIVSFSVPPRDAWIIERTEQLARVEYGSRGRSKMIIKALLTYLNKHSEGNPQSSLKSNHYRIRDIEREQAGIRFLKAKSKLSLRKISTVTGWSYGKVQRLCKDINAGSIRFGRRFPIDLFQQRWKLFLAGTSPEEAFRIS